MAIENERRPADFEDCRLPDHGDAIEVDEPDDKDAGGTATPLKAIRRGCISCAGSSHEVALCVATRCPLYLFRFGRGPTPDEIAAVASVAAHPLERPREKAPFTQADVAVKSGLQAIKRKCRDCSGYSFDEQRDCKFTRCDLYPHRLGKSSRTMTEEQRFAAAERLKHNLKRGLLPQDPDENPGSAEPDDGPLPL